MIWYASEERKASLSISEYKILDKLKKPSRLKLIRIASMEMEFARATCSSTQKKVSFPVVLDLSPSATEGEGASAVKVCPYCYCSLNGSRKGHPPFVKNVAPLKQKSMKARKNSQMKEKIQPQSIAAHEGRNLGKNGNETADQMEHGNCSVVGFVDVEVNQTKTIFEVGTKSPFLISEEDGVGECVDFEDGLSNLDANKIDNMKDGLVHLVENIDYLNTPSVFVHENQIQLQLLAVSDQDLDVGYRQGYFHELKVHSLESSEQTGTEGKKSVKCLESEGFVADYVQSSCVNQVDKLEKEESCKFDEEVCDSIKPNVQEFHEFMPFSALKFTEENTVEFIEGDGIEHGPREQGGNAANNGVKEFKSSCEPRKKLIIVRKKRINDDEEMNSRDFNPRPPTFLPLEPYPEPEKIDLRHQMVEEKKSAEEWMVDYALRRVLSKLATERKQRVELLVEAFESVAPIPKCETQSETELLGHGRHLLQPCGLKLLIK